MAQFRCFIFFLLLGLLAEITGRKLNDSKCYDRKVMSMIEQRANRFFNRFWEWRSLDDPELAPILGVEKYYDRLKEMSLSSYKRRSDELVLFLTELNEIAEAAGEIRNPTLHLNLELLRDDIEQYLKGLKFKPYLWPLNNMEGPHLDFPRLINSMTTETIDDMNNILERMRLFSQQVNEIIGLLKEGVRLGITMHNLSFQKVGPVFKDMATKLFTESLFYKPFKTKPKNITQSEWVEIVKTGRALVVEHVNPSYNRLADFIMNVYSNNSRPFIAATSLPNGDKYYQACLNFHTTTNLTSHEIHDIGIKEVQRITQRMEDVKKKVRYNGTLVDFQQYLRSSKRFGFKSESDIINRYKNIQKKVNIKLKSFFLRLPQLPYVISPVPEEVAPNYPVGYYQNVSPDGERPGIFYANTYKPTTRRQYVAVSLFLHEAVPGHHLQTSLTIEHGSPLPFRRFVGAGGGYYKVPAHFAINSAYLEGWGLYSEYLGEEMGLYSDIYDLFGRLSSEMLRACRLVVDTGIHAFGWTRDKAIAYLKKNTAEDALDIVSEVDRYITWPGQACAYKIGEMKLKELRRFCEKLLGDKFDIKRFHDFIATIGGVPLNVLEKQVDIFIEKELGVKAGKRFIAKFGKDVIT